VINAIVDQARELPFDDRNFGTKRVQRSKKAAEIVQKF
jgi:hypothetical protein